MSERSELIHVTAASTAPSAVALRSSDAISGAPTKEVRS